MLRWLLSGHVIGAETCRSNKLIKKLMVHFVGLLFHIAWKCTVQEIKCYFHVTRTWIGITHRLEALLQPCVRPSKRHILMLPHRIICCGTVILLLKIVMSYNGWICVLYTVSVIVRFMLSTLYGGKHDSIIDVWDHNGWQMIRSDLCVQSTGEWCVIVLLCAANYEFLIVCVHRSGSILRRIHIISRRQENVGY
jgi:hypothetical protein